MKTGISTKVLSTVFEISKSSIKRAVASVREALANNFVPHYLGFSHVSRDEVLEIHTRPLAKNLFESGTEALRWNVYLYTKERKFPISKTDLQYAQR
jgi:hypothetical protein